MQDFDQKLDFCVENNLNVLFRGKHGTGKTALARQSFEKHGLKWLYYSASTMDPWVDLVGVPKERNNDDGQPYLEMVMPKELAQGDVEAIMFDELNRSPAKVRNAVMEFIQFKSINGKKFENLKCIWAAINPEDEEGYDVEELDKAQLDRFHVHIEIPYRPNKEYFDQIYGSKITKCALEWWSQIPKSIEDSVSPRRLDYAIHMHNIGGDVFDVLPKDSNPYELKRRLNHSHPLDKLDEISKSRSSKERRKWIQDHDNFSACNKTIINNESYLKAFMPHMSCEQIVDILLRSTLAIAVTSKLLKRHKYKKIIEALQQIQHTNNNIIEAIQQNGVNLKGLVEITHGHDNDYNNPPHGNDYNNPPNEWYSLVNYNMIMGCDPSASVSYHTNGKFSTLEPCQLNPCWEIPAGSDPHKFITDSTPHESRRSLCEETMKRDLKNLKGTQQTSPDLELKQMWYNVFFNCDKDIRDIPIHSEPIKRLDNTEQIKNIEDQMIMLLYSAITDYDKEISAYKSSGYIRLFRKNLLHMMAMSKIAIDSSQNSSNTVEDYMDFNGKKTPILSLMGLWTITSAKYLNHEGLAFVSFISVQRQKRYVSDFYSCSTSTLLQILFSFISDYKQAFLNHCLPDNGVRHIKREKYELSDELSVNTPHAIECIKSVDSHADVLNWNLRDAYDYVKDRNWLSLKRQLPHLDQPPRP